MIDTASLNANELVSKLKSGDISSVDLCKAYIKRIEEFDNKPLKEMESLSAPPETLEPLDISPTILIVSDS